MSTPWLPDALWNLIQPMLPCPPPRPRGGRPRLPDRACLTGILFVLRSGIPWEMLPQEIGCGSGMSCWRRLRDWQQLGIWQLIHFVLLDWLARNGQIDWSRAVVDAGSVRAVFGGSRPVLIPRIGRSREASAICSVTGTEFRW
jgi:transposase